MKNFNILNLLAVAIIATILSSCVKKDVTFSFTQTAFDVKVDEIAFDGKTKVFNKTQFLTELKQNISKNGGDINQLKSLKLNSLKGTLTSGGNLDAIDGITLYFTAPAMDSIKVAFKSPIPKASTSVTFDNQYSELAPYFKGDAVTMIMEGYNNAMVPKSTYNFVATFDVTLSPTK